MPDRRTRKTKFIAKFTDILKNYNAALLVNVDNVGSNQMQKVRLALRGKATLLMGKNTLIRKVIRDFITESGKTEFEAVMPFVVNNMGFVFSNNNLADIRKVVLESKMPAAAKSGAFAPCNVMIPSGPTSLDPGQTSFFQALNIATKIAKGAIEIVNDVALIKTGDKVTPSHVALLDKLNIRPFFYTFKVTHVFESGSVYPADVLDMDQAALTGKFLNGVRRLAALSLAIHYPTAASLPHLVANAYKKMLALALVTSIEWAESKKYKEFLANPGVAAPVAAAPVAAAAAPAAKKEEKKKSDSDDYGGGFGLFD